VALATGGRDHLTHRLRVRLGTPVRVAIVLAVAQVATSAVAIWALDYGRTATIVTALAAFAAGCLIVARLDSPGWAPAATWTAEPVAPTSVS
jgi:hypothetical protein